MPLHVSAATVGPAVINSGDTITITVNAHVDKDLARGGARYTLPEDMPVFFKLPSGQFKRVFAPEFRLSRVPQPVRTSLVVVATESSVAVPIDIEIADLDETPPETLEKAVSIDVNVS